MKVLLCLDKLPMGNSLKANLLQVLKCLSVEEFFIDIYHIHPERNPAKDERNRDTVEEIHRDEYNALVREIGKYENELEEYLSENSDVAVLVNSVINKGDFRKTLEDYITFNRYDLMILNPPKKSSFQLVLKGSNTNWILDSLEIPVMILPEGLSFQSSEGSKSICFVDALTSYSNISKAGLVSKLGKDSIKYIYFGRESLCDEVETIVSADPLNSITKFTSVSDHNNICIMHHKNKGDFLNLIDKSFTKELLKTLENPLIIF